jgi:hypothetical protein
MHRAIWTQPVSVALAVMAIAGGTALAQGVLTQLGLTETAARALLMSEVQEAGGSGYSSKLAVAGRTAYPRVPEAARGPVTTALFAWAKTYVNSPAFATEYARIRAAKMPQRREYARTVDEELKKQLDDLLAGFENMKASAASMSPAERQRFLATLKESEDKLRSPEMQKVQRAALEEERAKQKADEDQIIARWQEDFPADRQALFARRLREFLDATADVDFEARKNIVRGLGGETVGFVLRPEDADKPWQWREAFVVGEEATTAGRAAAAAWLKEIGAK